jgi:LysR family glycine cleavage system transcriptional activator
MAGRLPPLRALEVFEAVCRHGGVTRAGSELGISPGAVSQQLRLLEDHLGQQLFSRQSRRLELTEPARAYFDLIFDGFERLRDAQKVLNRNRDFEGLAISALPSLLLKWLAPRAYAWLQTRPYLDLRLESTHREIPPSDGHVDFRLTYGRSVVQLPHLAELFTDSVVPVASPRLVGDIGAQLAPAAIARLPLVHIDWRPDHPNGPTWADWFKSAGTRYREVATTETYSLSSVALDAAIAGKGVALGQRSFIAEDLRAGRLVQLSDHALPMPAPYLVAWSDTALRKPGAREFLDWLVAEATAFR